MKRASRTSTPKPGQPAADAATYRDLLLFEERLKTNAARLRRRKRKYQFLLIQLVVTIVILACDAILSTNVILWPLNQLIRHIPYYAPQSDIIVPPYMIQSAFCIAVITLFLFYASGLYAEKIGYANRYVPHANKALRSFNMYLNVRTAPPRAPWPFSLILPPSTIAPSSSAPSSPSRPGSKAATRSRPTTPSPPRSPTPASGGKRSTGTTIPPIPPSANPRGELIFTSRVDKHFRESYERYRDAFERRRSERAMAEASGSLWKRFLAWLPLLWGSSSAIAVTGVGSTNVRRYAALGGTASGGERDGGGSPTSSAAPSRSVTPSAAIEAAAQAP
ncbi:hypothetical protein DL93DRAFT_2159338 [Clavulina sp. PMI_390]|nr:hypothetical protein DL93DRAFT_2159338 [Clavulina sp. PMI_390]